MVRTVTLPPVESGTLYECEYAVIIKSKDYIARAGLALWTGQAQPVGAGRRMGAPRRAGVAINSRSSTPTT